MCRVQDALSNHDESDEASKDPSVAPAASAHKNKRLTLAWLDGEVQSVSNLARICSVSWIHQDFLTSGV